MRPTTILVCLTIPDHADTLCENRCLFGAQAHCASQWTAMAAPSSHGLQAIHVRATDTIFVKRLRRSMTCECVHPHP